MTQTPPSEPDAGSRQLLTGVVPNSQVIGLLPRTDSHKAFDVLYVVRNDTSEEKTDSPVTVHQTIFHPGEQNLTEPFLIPSNRITGRPGAAPHAELSVIVSIKSGAEQASSFFDEAIKRLFDALPGQDYKVFRTESEHTITELAKSTFGPKAAQGIRQNIVLLSGDGGTIDLINGLIEHSSSGNYVRPNIVALPLGSGNALSNSYRYQQDDTHGLSTLLRGESRSLPMFRAIFSEGARMMVNEGREEVELSLYEGKPTMFGVVVCSWGLHSTLVADSDTAHYRQYGTDRFGMVAKELMFPPDGGQMHEFKGRVSFKITNDGEVAPKDSHSYVLASLVSHLEKTFCISPDSKSLDGKLRLVTIPPVAGQEMYDIMMAAYKDGAHVSMDKVAYHAIDRLDITFDEDDERWRRVCVDGKIIKMEKGGSLQLEMADLVVADIVCLEPST